jgi:hypothetical protein
VAVFALPAALPAIGRRARSAAAVLGLVTASAVIVHLSGGVVEAHFHFFVMVGVITLYQDWLPFGLALGYVVVHHTVLGGAGPERRVQPRRRPAGPLEVGADPRRVRARGQRRLPGQLAAQRAPGGRDQPPGQPPGGAGPHRPAHRRAQPAGVGGGAAPGAGAGPADGHRALCGHDRPGQLQVLQRPLRPPGRRPGPEGGGQRLAGRGPLHRPAGPLRRRGVRGPAAGVRARGRRPHRRAAAGRHPAGHLLGRAGLLGLPGGRQRADRAGRPGPLRGQGPRAATATSWPPDPPTPEPQPRRNPSPGCEAPWGEA